MKRSYGLFFPLDIKKNLFSSLNAYKSLCFSQKKEKISLPRSGVLFYPAIIAFFESFVQNILNWGYIDFVCAHIFDREKRFISWFEKWYHYTAKDFFHIFPPVKKVGSIFHPKFNLFSAFLTCLFAFKCFWFSCRRLKNM